MTRSRLADGKIEVVTLSESSIESATHLFFPDVLRETVSASSTQLNSNRAP